MCLCTYVCGDVQCRHRSFPTLLFKTGSLTAPSSTIQSDWLASESQGMLLSLPPQCCDPKHKLALPDSMWMLGIWTQLLLAQQVCHPLRVYLPSLLRQILYHIYGVLCIISLIRHPLTTSDCPTVFSILIYTSFSCLKCWCVGHVHHVLSLL